MDTFRRDFLRLAGSGLAGAAAASVAAPGAHGQPAPIPPAATSGAEKHFCRLGKVWRASPFARLGREPSKRADPIDQPVEHKEKMDDGKDQLRKGPGG